MMNSVPFFFMGDIAPDVEGFVELWTFYSSSGSRGGSAS